MVIIHVRSNILSKLLTKHFFPKDIQDLLEKTNFGKSKWFSLGTYHPSSQSDQHYCENVDEALGRYSS